MKVIEISEIEAINLANHLEYYILQEVRDAAEDYDNMEYLMNLVHVYERCKEVRDKAEKE
jgi:hypothetical protein